MVALENLARDELDLACNFSVTELQRVYVFEFHNPITP